MLVTTNWDTIVADSIQQLMAANYRLVLHPLHIHGSMMEPSTVYLPSELTREPYRTEADEKALGNIHGSVWRGLENVNRVIVYGLSIDPLDAELSQTLAAGWDNPSLEEIIIINPSHSMVAHRVNLLLNRQRNVRVVSLNPDTLSEEADYTIWRHSKK